MLFWLGCVISESPYEEGWLDSGLDEHDEGRADDGDEETSDTPEADSAAILELSFPTTLACGETADGLVTVENTGTAIWSRDAGYKLGAVDDDDPLLDSNDVRVWLQDGDTVFPGGTFTFTVPLRAPDSATTAWTDWQMVHEHVAWFGDTVGVEVEVACGSDAQSDEVPEDDADYPLPLPDMGWVVDQVAADHPDWLADSCQDAGGSWDFLDEVVDRLRTHDERWGYNWKRGVEGDPSQDVVDYHYGPGDHEGSEEVYILDVITGHCGDDPQPGWLDQTAATAAAGTIGVWTGRGRF